MRYLPSELEDEPDQWNLIIIDGVAGVLTLTAIDSTALSRSCMGRVQHNDQPPPTPLAVAFSLYSVPVCTRNTDYEYESAHLFGGQMYGT